MMKVVFVSWDGSADKYMESLFLPIFGCAKAADLEIHVLQFTWASQEQRNSTAEAAGRLGLPYTSHGIWRRPTLLSTPAMIVHGARVITRYVRRHGIDLIMPRSTIPAGMALLALKRLPGMKLLFDADGLMADERVDFGGWSPTGPVYRIFRAIENSAVRRADVVVTRTSRAKAILAKRAGFAEAAHVVVVPNGKDAELFHPGTTAEREATKQALGLEPTQPLVVYAGSLGPQYHPDRMFAFVEALLQKRSDIHLLMMSGSQEIAQKTAECGKLSPSNCTIQKVEPEEVPRYLAAADLGLAFRTPSFSQQAVAPIKVGEYLLCGVPVLSSSGIGDLDDQLDVTTGKLIKSLDAGSLEEAAVWFLDEVIPARDCYRTACRKRGVELFSLERSAAQYGKAFNLVPSRTA